MKGLTDWMMEVQYRTYQRVSLPGDECLLRSPVVHPLRRNSHSKNQGAHLRREHSTESLRETSHRRAR